MKKILFIVSIFIYLNLSINAQQVEHDSMKYQLDTVYVNSNRFEQPIHQIPFSIDVLDSAYLSLKTKNISSESIYLV